MATRWTLPQRDFFEPTPPVDQLAETEQREALNLLQALLAEAMNQARSMRPRARRR